MVQLCFFSFSGNIFASIFIGNYAKSLIYQRVSIIVGWPWKWIVTSFVSNDANECSLNILPLPHLRMDKTNAIHLQYLFLWSMTIALAITDTSSWESKWANSGAQMITISLKLKLKFSLDCKRRVEEYQQPHLKELLSIPKQYKPCPKTIHPLLCRTKPLSQKTIF